MRKCKSLWLFIGVLSLLQSALAQSTGYQLEVRQGQDLEEVIERLGQDYQIDFAYVPQVLASKRLEAASFSASSIDSLLQQLLRGIPVQYHVQAQDRVLLRGISPRRETQSPRPRLLSGRITDASSGRPMMNVALALDTLELGTLSDERGHFSLKVPGSLEQHTLWVYHIGYKTRRLRVRDLTGEYTDIRLTPEPLSLEEVLIVDQLPSLAASLSDGSIRLRNGSLKGNQAAALAGSDVFRNVQLMAGVSVDNDLSSEIRIRGSDADETLIVLDGMPLYKVDHFYGVFSAVNASYLEDVALYKNALPIQYGGRTGGMLLMRSTEEVDRFSGQADLNLLSAALQMNIPVSEELGLSLSGRRSHTNVADSKLFEWLDRKVENYVEDEAELSRPDVLNTNPQFGFSDWHGKLLYTPADGHRLALNVYQSYDDFLNRYDNQFFTRFRNRLALFEEDFNNEQGWRNTGSSVQYQGQLSRQWSLEAAGFFTDYRFSEGLDVRIRRTTALNSRVLQLQNDQFNQVKNLGGHALLNRKGAASSLLQLGGSWNHYRTDFSVASEVDTILASRGQSSDLQAFANYQWRPAERLEIALGGRLNYYRQTRDWYLAPRITANYRFDNGLALKSSFCINYQFIRELTHENRLGQTVDLVVLSDEKRFPVGQATNYMLGAGYRTRHWLFDLELYHKDLDKVIDHSSLIPGFGDAALRPGRRQNYVIFIGAGTVNGADLTVGWEYPRYQGHLAYTLSKSVSRFPQILKGTPIPARDDRRHQLKWVNTWRVGAFELSANYIFVSGRPYYDQQVIQSDRRKRFVRWLPSYQRLDLGLNYGFGIGSANATVGLSVFNLTNNANVKYLQFIYSTNAEEDNRLINRIIGSQAELLDRTLNLSFGLAF